MQGQDKDWLQISACAKHFAVHSWNTPSTYMVYPSAQDLADTYLPAFETAVKAGVSGLMCR
jgi:beta-glucosidase